MNLFPRGIPVSENYLLEHLLPQSRKYYLKFSVNG